MSTAPLLRGAVPGTPAPAARPCGKVALGPSAFEEGTVAADADLLRPKPFHLMPSVGSWLRPMPTR
eukprot:6935867-Alexandrium_andersonii.AAC.1